MTQHHEAWLDDTTMLARDTFAETRCQKKFKFCFQKKFKFCFSERHLPGGRVRFLELNVKHFEHCLRPNFRSTCRLFRDKKLSALDLRGCQQTIDDPMVRTMAVWDEAR